MINIDYLHHGIDEQDFPILVSFALFELPLSQNRLGLFLESSIQADEYDQKYNQQFLKLSIQRLKQIGAIDHVPGFGYHATPEIAHAVLLHLFLHDDLKAWIKDCMSFLDINREYTTWSTPTPQFCQREMFFAAVFGDINRLLNWRKIFFDFAFNQDDFLVKKYFATPAGQALFSELPFNAQAILLADWMNEANWTLINCENAYRYVKKNVAQNFKDSPELLSTFVIQALLRGESITYIEQTLAQISAQPNDFIHILPSLMRGDFQTSALIIDKVADVFKNVTGKRKLIAEGTMGFFYTALLLASNSPAHLKRAKEQCDDGVKNRIAHFYSAVKPLIEHRLKGTAVVESAKGRFRQGLDDIFVRFAYFWLDMSVNQSDHAYLDTLYLHSAQNGYEWVAAEIDQLRHNQFNWPLQMDNWHDTRQMRPLCLALQREANWERALSALSALSTANINANVQDVRIAWFIECAPHYINLEPREQKKSAKGVWSKGRPIALKRLSYEQETLAGITEQDKKVASCIRKSYDNYYGGSDYEINGEKALPFLIGHPAVFWLDAPDIGIDIVKGEITLNLKQQGDQIQLQLDPSINDEAVVWKKQTPTRLMIYPTSAEIKQIASIIGKGLTVPNNAKDQLMSAIAAIAPHLSIQSDIPELAQHIEQIPPDTTLYVHLLPLKEGLRIQIKVRPLPEGNWHHPGQGSAVIVGELAGKAIQTQRALSTEQTSFDALLQTCPAFELAHHEHQEWTVEHPEACLEILSQLQQAQLSGDIGAPVQLVWPEGERFRIKSQRHTNQLQLSIKKQGDWFVAGGELQLDDGKVLALRELLQLAANTEGRFIALGENNFLALTDAFKKRLQDLHALSDSSSKDGIRINPLAAPMLAELADEVDDLKVDAAWKKQLAKLDELAHFVPVLPANLQATLREYQTQGFEWLSRLAHWGVGACLADDMGLGKTVQTLALMLERAPNGPALVVAPISVALNWVSEAARFAPSLKVRAYHEKRDLSELGAFDVVVTSYGLLQQDSDLFAQQHWHTAVLDEAQVIKNAATKRSQAAMALQADFKMIASGTPVENHLGELWNLFRFINPGLLGSKERFTERFSHPIERGNQVARDQLKRLIQPFILRRTKAQVLTELPSRTEITLQVELSDEERHLYEALRQEALDKLANMPPEGKAMQVLAEITKLRRFCCNPQLVLKHARVAGSKLAVLADVVEELLDNQHKALIFSQFVDHLAIVRAWLDEKGIAYHYLDGSTPAAERKKRVDAFQAGGSDLFLISLKAGGTGLNLTAADFVIHLDPWWNPAVEDQASDRAHRMGQTRPVTIYRLVAQNTIEDQIIALHAKKRDLADSLLEGGDASGKLDTAALLQLLKTNG